MANMRSVIVIVALNLAFSSCVDFAEEKGQTTNRNKSTPTQQTYFPPAAKTENESPDDQNEPSSDELERNTPIELRQQTRCVIEENVTITPDGDGVVPLAVTFDSSASKAPCGRIVKRIWHFGDGAKARGAKVTHTYAMSGEYIANLHLADNKGNRNLLEIDYAVTVTAVRVSTERLTRKPGGPVR
jgi:PKD repeat protein